MGNPLIIENKIKCVNGGKRCGIFTMLHIPPKMFVLLDQRLASIWRESSKCKEQKENNKSLSLRTFIKQNI